MLYHCDRCHEAFEGFEDEGGTGGFYYVNKGVWASFANPFETVVCDKCMWDDPRYIAVFGKVS